MKRLAGLDLRIFLDLIEKSVDSTIRSHRFDEQEALIIEFELSPKDFRLALFSKLIPGKWRPPAAYRIDSFEFISRDLLRLLELTKLYPKYILNLAEMDGRFVDLITPLKGHLHHPQIAVKKLEQVRDQIFAEIQKKQMTLRDVARLTGLTEMSLHNYRKKANLRLDNLLKLCQVLNIELYIKPEDEEFEPRLARTKPSSLK